MKKCICVLSMHQSAAGLSATLGSVLREAIQGHLQYKGAHKLEVTVQQSNG